MSARLVAQHESIQPGGQTGIGVLFKIAQGWHIYAEDPGDAGLATEVLWFVPDGASVSKLEWPQPKEFTDSGGIHTFGYTDEVLLKNSMTLEPAFKVGSTLQVRAKVKWLACHEICVPGAANLVLEVPVRAETPEDSQYAPFFMKLSRNYIRGTSHGAITR